MPIDLSELSPKELASLISQAQKRKAAIAKRAPIAKVRARILKIAKAEGYSVDELFSTGGSAAPKGKKVRKSPIAGRKLGKVAPKYRNPSNSRETWTGRGRQPRWLASYIAVGSRLEDFLITR